MLVFAGLAVVLAAAGLIGVLLRGQFFLEDNPNLALQKGVRATCDSVEQEALSAAMAIDGDDTAPTIYNWNFPKKFQFLLLC